MPAKPSYRPRLVNYLVPIGLFVLVATVALLLVRGYSFNLTTVSLQKTGLIVLDSSPKDAFVTIGNTVEPERTRSTFKLAPGTYDVKVDMPNVHPWQQQIRLEPGEAVLQENILLFKTRPDQTSLTPGATPGQSLSPDGKELAFLGPAASEVTLSKTSTTRSDAAQTVTALPAGYAAPRSFSWSSDGSRLIVSAANETRLVTVSDGQTLTFGVGGRAAVAPQQSDAVIVEPEPGRLVRATSGPGAIVEPYETDVAAWTVSGSTLYVARTDGSVIRRNSPTDRKVVAEKRPLTALAAAAGADRVFGRDASGTIYLITDDGLQEVAKDADRFVVSRDGDQVAYLKQRELRLWDRNDDTDVLLTRFTEPPEQLAVVPGGHYVLYGRAGELHAIAADGTNDVELASGTDLSEVVNREHVLVRKRTSGQSVSLTILDR